MYEKPAGFLSWYIRLNTALLFAAQWKEGIHPCPRSPSVSELVQSSGNRHSLLPFPGILPSHHKLQYFPHKQPTLWSIELSQVQLARNETLAGVDKECCFDRHNRVFRPQVFCSPSVCSEGRGCISNVSASFDSSEMQARLPSPKIMPHSEVLRYIL